MITGTERLIEVLRKKVQPKSQYYCGLPNPQLTRSTEQPAATGLEYNSGRRLLQGPSGNLSGSSTVSARRRRLFFLGGKDDLDTGDPQRRPMDARPTNRLLIDVDVLRPDTFTHRSQSEDYPLTRDYVSYQIIFSK